MKPPTLESLKGNYWIYHYDDYVVIIGKKLYIFRSDGSFVACRPDLKNVYKVAFISDFRLLVDGGRRSYHLISLKDGTEIWSTPQTVRETYSDKFAVTPDEEYAYEYYWKSEELYLAKITLETGKLSVIDVNPGLRSTVDIICNEDGTPCLLQRHYSDISGKKISENGILFQYQDVLRIGSSYYWKEKWTFSGSKISASFLDDVDTIVTNDLYLYKPSRAELSSLVDDESRCMLPKESPFFCRYDKSRNYLLVSYCMCNVVVDISERKVIARYSGEHTKGNLINGEFWISSDDGMIRKPFPLVEEIPPQKFTSLI